METRGELVLAVGDIVVYASHGVGRIAALRDESIVLEFARSGLSVVMPLERASACIRPLSTEPQIVSVGQTLGGIDADVHSNWQHRLKATKAKVAGGEAVELAEVVRDASRRDERASSDNELRNLSLTERQLYLKARQLLVDEIGASRGVDETHADEWIAEQLAGSGQKACSPQPQGLMTLDSALGATVEASGNRARRRRR